MKIGGLDERFGLGLFDDDDLAERARRAGFALAVAHDLFVHHFGSRTFQGNGVNAGKLLDENARRFAEKWRLRDGDGGRERVLIKPWRRPVENGDAQRNPGRVDVGQAFQPDILRRAERRQARKPDLRAERRQAGKPDLRKANSALEGDVAPGRAPVSLEGQAQSIDAPGDRAVPDADRATVSLTMIAKNEQDHLPKCLESVRRLFDEIVVVDTGSTDRTKEIAREFGAKVFDFVWIDDFAAARNEALSHATCDYAFWLDADDVLEPAEREKLRALFAGLTRPSTGDATGAMSPLTPPLTRPAGDLSPRERRRRLPWRCR